MSVALLAAARLAESVELDFGRITERTDVVTNLTKPSLTGGGL
jgi:hypothetical protein